MHRKALFTALGLALTSALAAGCGASSGSGGKDSLTFVSYGPGSYQDGQESAWLKPFESEDKAKVVIDGPSDNAKLKAMVQSGRVTWDVMDTDAITAREQCGTLVEKIDLGPVAGAFPAGMQSECGVPDALFGLIFMYNTKTYGDHPPTSLADFFDTKKFPGTRLIAGGDPTIGTLEAALMGDGVAPDQLYPLDVDRALSVYDRIKKNLKFADTYSQQQQFMVDNQADMSLVVSARAYSVLKSGGDFWKPVWDKVPVTYDVLVIPKGSKNKALAEKLITFASQPEQAAGFAQASGAGPANTAAKPALNAQQQEVDVFGAHQDAQVILDADWWTEHHEDVVKAWTTWMTG